MDRRGIQVLIVEDHALVGAALAAALSAEPDIDVAGVVQSFADLDAVTDFYPDPAEPIDVAVVDYYLPNGTGIEVALFLAERRPATRVVMMSGESSPEHLREAIEAGCVAFVNKSSALGDLVRAVRAAADGRASFDAESLQIALSAAFADPTSAPTTSVLSEREREILTMLAGGLRTEVMATELYLSQHTVRNHVRNLTAKLGAHSRLEAVAIAARDGLISIVPSPQRHGAGGTEQTKAPGSVPTPGGTG